MNNDFDIMNELVKLEKQVNKLDKDICKNTKNNNLLQQKIDKAIEYIENQKSYEEICEDKYKGNGTYYENVIREKDINKLLDILRGEE